MLDCQTTLAGPAEFHGVGLHSGCRSNLIIHPAPAGSGILFRRSDLDYFVIEASHRYIANVSYATSLMKQGVLVSTVEHVLSALYGLGIDNAILDVDNLEVPILDGSARPYTDAILAAGRRELDQPRRRLRLYETIHHQSGDKWIQATPANNLRIEYTIDFAHSAIGRQTIALDITAGSYRDELAACRTFGFLKEINHLQENGLVKGGSLENAVVLSDDGILNPEGLRFPDEFVRHKAMDFLGDISLLGVPVLGHFKIFKGGHAMHAGLVKKILATPATPPLEHPPEAILSASLC